MTQPSPSSTSQGPPVLTVSQFTQAIKLSLESTFPSIWLQGEISNCKLQTSGHLYFSLKDAKAQIGAVMFRGEMTSLRTVPKDGDHVIVCGDLNVYPPSGKYQIVVRELRQMGVGELLQKLEELKLKLLKKGWFRPDHKQPIPKFPKRIGVVTSPTGAVIQDILHVLSRRYSGFHLILNPVRVQGEGAAQEIARAIKQFNDYELVDVMIVGRGGGSIEDLWAFNEEVVADAIYHSRIPIISAVGHETDHCIADYVADMRAPTPSAAAEMVIAEKSQQLNHLEQIQKRLLHTVNQTLRYSKQQLESIRRQPLLSSPYALLGMRMQWLDGARQNLELSVQRMLQKYRILLEARQRQTEALKPMSQIQHVRQKLNQFQKTFENCLITQVGFRKKTIQQTQDLLIRALKNQLHRKCQLFVAATQYRQLDQIGQRQLSDHRQSFLHLQEALHAINPKNLLSKGYCILFAQKDHSIITSVRTIAPDDTIRVILGDGELISVVKDVCPK